MVGFVYFGTHLENKTKFVYACVIGGEGGDYGILLLNVCIKGEGEPTHTMVPCWMTATLPPRNQCMVCFATAVPNVKDCPGKIEEGPYLYSIVDFIDSSKALDQ